MVLSEICYAAARINIVNIVDKVLYESKFTFNLGLGDHAARINFFSLVYHYRCLEYPANTLGLVVRYFVFALILRGVF